LRDVIYPVRATCIAQEIAAGLIDSSGIHHVFRLDTWKRADWLLWGSQQQLIPGSGLSADFCREDDRWGRRD